MIKRGQGLSLNTIIVAIIVLVVLVVLVLVFTGFFGSRVAPELGESCTNLGGECIAGNECGSNLFGAERQRLTGGDAACQGGICCARGFGTRTGDCSAAAGDTCGSIGGQCVTASQAANPLVLEDGTELNCLQHSDLTCNGNTVCCTFS